MFDDHIINGGRKVPRKPSLSVYDNRKPPAPTADPAYHAQFDTRFDADAPRTHGRDKALLVALGVDGDVPFREAAMNANLWHTWAVGGVRYAMNLDPPANDNHEIAAVAA